MAGITLGTLLRTEIAGPLGADVHIGLPRAEHGRVADFLWPSTQPPEGAGLSGDDTPDTSLLLSMRQALAPYLTSDSEAGETDRSLVRNLYEPLYQALAGLG